MHPYIRRHCLTSPPDGTLITVGLASAPVPAFDTSVGTQDWGVPGSAGTSMTRPPRRPAGPPNRARTMEHILRATPVLRDAPVPCPGSSPGLRD
ncbi:hypothetical protein GCM10022420_086540 [Streptomyces iranensis]